jgi:hypothetical protein
MTWCGLWILPAQAMPLPVPDDADALLARRLVALLFADDFNALSDTPQGLQKAVDVTYEWCCKWRMKANVGPNKSAVMLFAPECACTADAAGWGDRCGAVSHCQWWTSTSTWG